MRSANQSGQTLIEVVVSISIGVFVVAALAYATIATIRNAQLAQNQSQATKLSQEGIERVRAARDRNSPLSGLTNVDNWEDPDLWSSSGHISDLGGCTPPCYFQLLADGTLALRASFDASTDTAVNGRFTRAVVLSDAYLAGYCPMNINYQVEKCATVIVRWTDFSGTHDSRVTTILSKLIQ